MIRCLFLAIAVYCCFGNKAFCDDTRLVTITINNGTPEFELLPSIEVFGQAPEPFIKSDSDTFEYKFRVSDKDWFNPVDIKLVWKGDYQRSDGSKGNLNQRISLRIRRDFPDSFSFPVFFSNSRTQSEMARLEGMKNPNDQFEVFFRSWQIAEYFRGTLANTHPLAKRASKLFFFSSVSLAKIPDYVVVVSEYANQFVDDAFNNDPKYTDLYNDLESVYWFDLPKIDGYVKNGNCNTAQMVLNDLERKKDSEPLAFKLRYGDGSKVLDEKNGLVAKCIGSPLAQ